MTAAFPTTESLPRHSGGHDGRYVKTKKALVFKIRVTLPPSPVFESGENTSV